MNRDICECCGAPLEEKIYYNNPPIRTKKCSRCGRKQEIFSDEELEHYNQLRHHIPRMVKRSPRMEDIIAQWLKYCSEYSDICEEKDHCPFFEQKEEVTREYHCKERIMSYAADIIKKLEEKH